MTITKAVIQYDKIIIRLVHVNVQEYQVSLCSEIHVYVSDHSSVIYDVYIKVGSHLNHIQFEQNYKYNS